MPNLSRAEATLVSALQHLGGVHAGTTSDANALELAKAELKGTRAELGKVRARLTALEDENRLLRQSPDVVAVAQTTRQGAMFANALDCILIADDRGRYLDANPAACALLGYTPAEIVQLSVEDITPEAHRPSLAKSWSDFLAIGTMSGEYAVRHRTGREISGRVSRSGQYFAR